jgi:hypothetical protein
MDLHAIRAELGYTDVLSSREAMARTARWYVDNPLPPGGTMEEQLGDPFDYEAEDRMIAAALEARERLGDVALLSTAELAHPYPHPTEPGQATDHRGR